MPGSRGRWRTSSRSIDGKWASAPLPEGSAGCKTTIAGDSIIMLSQTKLSDAAWKWMEFLSEPENMALLNLGTKKNPATLLPPRSSPLEQPGHVQVEPGAEGFRDQHEVRHHQPEPEPELGEVDSGPLSDALAHGIYGKGNIDQELTSAAQKADDLLGQPSSSTSRGSTTSPGSVTTR